ncbi:hypothetical protein BpV1_166 [Bathycoccus sp. RCC1105 virus BpV1]|uniref:hypothetical protein n=1 Tax=Bathycoccus sp. RCC1105 virus BpV1 TaxID=880159 RepID=UPI0001EF43F8|nr:hypothetical protein BpV1_166 [Bathycoccus sp. RCC1105 virus BpV1]ADQ91793.1 hypothetical protein BpV1_166 [Bathycoccus sp. RCC1105 virus BpV1]
MPIGGSATELNITGAKLKVSGGVQVSGSIAYTTDATGFGGVTAQIDNGDTLNITSGKLTGVTKIDRSTAATITAITHTNVNNNTTIHIALKNTSSIRGVFITLGTFASDDTVKVNYTDNYLIGPGETGMLTLRKVNGVLSLFAREMFSSKATSFDATDNSPFYIKDGVNYKYPLYKFVGTGLTSIPINGVTYYRPSMGITTKSRPPKGLPELIVTPTGNLAIGNSAAGTTVNYDVWGVPSSFDFGSIYQGTTKKATFLLENGEASGSFTESGASSGDAYSLYVERTDTSTSDTLNIDTSGFVGTIAFHYGAFSASDYSGAYSTVEEAATAGFVYSDTSTTTYTWGTLSNITNKNYRSVYTWTPPNEIDAYVLLVGGGGSGGRSNNTGGGGGGGGGGVILSYNTLTNLEKIIEVPQGSASQTTYKKQGNAGFNTYFSGIGTAFGGGRGGGYDFIQPKEGGSGGGSAQDNDRGGSSDNMIGRGIIGQGFDGGDSSTTSTTGSGSGGGGAGGVGGDTVSDTQGGNGGEGRDVSSIFGTTYGVNGIFGGGGGGGVYNSSGTSGSGGSGGGGEGGLGNDSGSNGIVHTGGGGGGSSGSGSSSGSSGSGIVLVKFMGSGKTIPKVTGASFDSTNVTFTVQGASNITNIKYTVNGGSVADTPVGTLSVAHSLSASAAISVVAWAVDTSGNQLSAKKTVTGTIP